MHQFGVFSFDTDHDIWALSKPNIHQYTNTKTLCVIRNYRLRPDDSQKLCAVSTYNVASGPGSAPISDPVLVSVHPY